VKSSSHRLVALDGIRGAAALIILVFHLSGERLFEHASLAVDLFFLLSGFILAHAFEAKLQAGMGIWEFMRLRLIRLYPLYAIGLLFGIVAYHGEMGIVWPTLKGVLFIPSMGDRLFPFNPPSWTLFDQLLMNIVFGLMMASRVGIKILFFIGASALSVYYYLHARAHFNLADGYSASKWWIGAIRICFSFPLGALIYSYSKQFVFPSLNAWWLLFTLAAITAIPSALKHTPTIYMFSAIFICPLIIFAGNSAHVDHWAAAFFTWLGAISYALYAVHYPILHLAYRLGYRSTLDSFVTVLIVIAVAHWLTYRVDPIVRGYLSALGKAPPVPIPALEKSSDVFPS
jgi:peptidoglycan/LPS O-acetylase OafA/YrhL